MTSPSMTHAYTQLEEMKKKLVVTSLKYHGLLALCIIFLISTIAFFFLGLRVTSQLEIPSYLPILYMILLIVSVISLLVSAAYFEKYCFIYPKLYAKVMLTEAIIIRGQASLDLLEEVKRVFEEENQEQP